MRSKNKIQEEAINAHIAMGCKSIIGLSVGMGKTKIAIDRIKSLREENPYIKVLFTGARNVYINNLKDELQKWECDETNIDMICNKSLLNYIEHYDLIIYDEAHKEASLVYHFLQKLIEINPKVEILGLTGTPIADHEIYSILPISYTYLLNDAVDNQFLNNFGITIVRHSMSLQEHKMYTYLYNKYQMCDSNSKYSPALSKLKVLLNNLECKVKLVNELINTKFKDEKLLIYAGSIDQAKNIPVLQYNSKLPKKEKEANYKEFYGSSCGKLTNVGMLKESVSIPNLKYGMVMGIESSQSSKIQLIGRFCRLTVEEVSHIYFFVGRGTIEEKWVYNGLDKFKDKIRLIDIYQDVN
jgi:superfamily II DNA or RNA helicase